MMKRKIVSGLVVLMMVFTVGLSTGCREDGPGPDPINKDMTQLYVQNYNGGFGYAWLDELKPRFEALHANDEIEPGKKGVQLIIDRVNKTKGNALNISSSTYDVFFAEELSWFPFVSQNSFLDISDVVESITAQENVDLSETQKAALTAYDGKYYVIPHYESAFGITYDKDIFNLKRLYIDKDGDYCNAKGDLAAGPDGVEGTFDDGLPATMEEFFELCNYMKNTAGVTPISVTGNYADRYTANFVNRVISAYNGTAISEANYSFNQKDVTYITSVTPKSDSVLGYEFTTKTTDITSQNGYLMYQTPGRLYGFAFLEKLLKNKCFSDEALSGTKSHTSAQEDFINSTYKASNPTAMLMEGTWWENEATDSGAFERSEAVYGDTASKYSRNFGFMPLPTKIDANDKNVGDPYAAIDVYAAYGFIKSNIDSKKINIAKEFLKFCYSTENLEKFTEITGTPRSLKYEISDDTYNGLTAFAQDVWNVHKQGKSVLQLSSNPLYYENTTSFDSLITIGSGNYAYPFSAIRSGAKTAQTYFEGAWISDASWKSSYSKYFS